MICGLFMMTASIKNIVARGLDLNGAGDEPGSMYGVPDASWYRSPWRERVGVNSSSFDHNFKMDEVEPMGRDEIRSVLTRMDG